MMDCFGHTECELLNLNFQVSHSMNTASLIRGKLTQDTLKNIRKDLYFEIIDHCLHQAKEEITSGKQWDDCWPEGYISKFRKRKSSQEEKQSILNILILQLPLLVNVPSICISIKF